VYEVSVMSVTSVYQTYTINHRHSINVIIMTDDGLIHR